MNDNSLYVDKFYTAQSEFEDIVFGKDLHDGMIVLLADDALRIDMDDIRNKYDQARADEVNRWCEISQLWMENMDHGVMVRFVGIYPDGTQRVRRYNTSFAWIVKREPDTP